MSQFLSNMLSRHSQSENNVQPRGLGVFETSGFMPESHPPGTTVDNIDANTDTTTSENRMINSRLDTMSTTQSIQNIIPSENTIIEPRSDTMITSQSMQNISSKQNDSINRQENHQRIDTSNAKTQQVGNRIIEKMNFKTEKGPTKKPNIARAEAYFGATTKGENSLKSVPNTLEIPKPDKQFPNPNTTQLDGQHTPLEFTDRVFVKPNKELQNGFPPNFNANIQNGISSRAYNSHETLNAEQSPTIKIHIGRIDIKAVKPPELTTRKPRKTNNSTLSLDQFLKKRERK